MDKDIFQALGGTVTFYMSALVDLQTECTTQGSIWEAYFFPWIPVTSSLLWLIHGTSLNRKGN